MNIYKTELIYVGRIGIVNAVFVIKKLWLSQVEKIWIDMKLYNCHFDKLNIDPMRCTDKLTHFMVITHVKVLHTSDCKNNTVGTVNISLTVVLESVTTAFEIVTFVIEIVTFV